MLKGYDKPKKAPLKKGYDGSTIEEMPPMVSFTDKDIPDLKDWKVGSTYKLQLEVEQTGLDKHEDAMEGSDRLHGMFKVKNVKVL